LLPTACVSGGWSVTCHCNRAQTTGTKQTILEKWLYFEADFFVKSLRVFFITDGWTSVSRFQPERIFEREILKDRLVDGWSSDGGSDVLRGVRAGQAHDGDLGRVSVSAPFVIRVGLRLKLQ
jgi:hypothetical protein